MSWNVWNRCCKKVDSQGEHFTGIHDRFLRDPVYRESQLLFGWTEQKCTEMDELAEQDHTYRLSKEEFKRYQGQWYLTLKKSGKNAPMRLRPDFRAAVSLKNRLHRESGERDGTLPPAIHGGTRLTGVGGVHNIFLSDLFFITVGFVYRRWRSTVNDGWCRQIHLTRHFSPAQCACLMMWITPQGSSVCTSASFHLHVIHGDQLIVSRCFLALPFSVCLSISYLFSSHFYLYSDLNSFFHVDNAKANNPCAPPTEESCPLAESTLPTGYEPKLLDDFHYSETSAMVFQDESGDKDAVPSYLCDAELADETIGKALSSPLFLQEREEPADRRQAYHSHEECLLPAQSFFAHKYGETRFRTWFVQTKIKSRHGKRNNQDSPWKTKRANSRWFLEPKFRNTNFKQILKGEVSIQELNGIIESQRREIDHTLACDEQLRHLLKDTTTQLQELIGHRTPNIGFFVCVCVCWRRAEIERGTKDEKLAWLSISTEKNRSRTWTKGEKACMIPIITTNTNDVHHFDMKLLLSARCPLLL